MPRTVAEDFIKQFSRDEDLKNPFAVGMKMILTSEEASLSTTIYEAIKQSLKHLKEYLNCANILIFNKHKKLIVSHRKSRKDITDYVKKLLDEYTIGNENKEFIYSPRKKVKTKLNIFKVDTEKLVYYIVFVDSKLNKDKKTDEFISIIKASLYVIFSLAEKNEYDSMTGVKNRRMFDLKVDSLKGETKKVLFMNLDLYRLKVINDTYGHSKGSLYIKQAAKLLNKSFPDCVYRIGGDEFEIISLNCNNVDSKMQTINQNLAKMLKKSISPNEEYYINYGYIIESPRSKPINDFYNEADQRLYESKRETYNKFKGHDRRVRSE